MRGPTRGARFVERPSGLLVDVRANDLVLSGEMFARSGQALNFARNSGNARMIDANGIYSTATTNELRVEMLDADTPALLLERDAINTCQRSSNFGTLWTPVSAPTLIDNARFIGDLALSLIGDTDAVNQSCYQIAPALTVSGFYSLALVMAPSSKPAGGSLFFLNDFTSGISKITATIKWDATTGDPIVTLTAGVFGGFTKLANGAYEIRIVSSTAIVAANLNVIRIAPCAITTEVGSCYFGGVNLIAANWATSLIDTPASANVERMADMLTVPIGFLPMGMTIYGKCQFATAQGRAFDTLVSIGSSDLTSDAQRAIGVGRGSSGAIITRETTGSAHTDAVGTAVAGFVPSIHEFVAHISPTAIDISVDGAAATTSAQAMVATFSNQIMYLPGDNNIRWLTLKVAAGSAYSLADMQTLN